VTSLDDELLVIGGSGFLGAHLLAQAGAGARGWGRVLGASRAPERCPRLVPDLRFEALAWDGTRPGAAAALFERCRPTHVVLAAALSRPGPCEADPGLAEALNVELPAEIASQCRERGVRLVHVSTDLVFGAGAPRGERYTEDDEPAPVHVYGRTKSAGEKRVLEEDPDALVVRVPLLYGDSGGRGLGASDDLLELIARDETPNLFQDEWRTPLDVAQAAAGILEAVRKPLSGRLHVAGPERVNRHELGLTVLAGAGFPPEEARRRVRACLRADLGLESTRPADLSLDTTRARALLATVLLSPRESLTVR
jgi:dTDP-4-dehydrorhamnose reductase